MKINTFIVACCLILSSGCALSRDVVYLDDRIDAVEKKISRQKSSEQDTAKAIRGEYAKLNNRLDRFADQIRRIDGSLEENLYTEEKNRNASDVVKKEIERIDLLISQLARRIEHVESYVGYDGKATKPPVLHEQPVADGSEVSSAAETKLYNNALNALDKDDMKGARDGFSKMLELYPKSPQADNAQFWIGESYYREKWFQKAILEYQKVIENYPKGNKVPGAYLKQGLAFFELGEDDNAKLILSELLKKFPGSSEADIAKKKLASTP